MRICHVVEASGGGVGQVIIDLVRSGIAAGNDITVIYGIARATPHFIQSLTPLLAEKLIPISMQREIGMHDIPDAWNLYQCLWRTGPFDVIHGHSSKGGALVRITGLLFPRAAKLYSPHAFVTLNSKASPVYGFFEKILSWLPGTIVTLSEVEKTHALRDLGISAQKIVVIPNGIKIDYPASRDTARKTMGYDEGCFVVGFVGRFVPQKNPERLIEAFAAAAKNNPSLRLALVGDGILRTNMEAAVAEQKVEDKVRFFSGYIGRDLMPGFDCLACASDYEGFAIVFLEALAAGVPVVTTPVGGAHETVIQGETGFMVSDFKPESPAQAILKIASLDPAQKAKMNQNALRHAQNFSLEHVAGQLQSLYATLLEKTAR